MEEKKKGVQKKRIINIHPVLKLIGVKVNNMEKKKEMKVGFKALAKGAAKEYMKKGKSAEKAKEIGKAIAAKVGMKKYGKAGMMKKAMAGRKAMAKKK